MLWRAIATARAAPSEGEERAATKVARPSGKLWMPIAKPTTRNNKSVIVPIAPFTLKF